MKITLMSRRVQLAVCVAVLPGTIAYASVSFKVVADTNTGVPGNGNPFTGFSPTSVNFDGNAVSFVGGNATVGGAYAGLNSLSALADTNTPVPAASGNFGSFGGANDQSGSFVISGGVSSSAGGIYAHPAGGSLTKIADTNTIAPGTSVTFTSFSSLPAVNSDGAVAFVGTAAHAAGGTAGIYSNLGGTLHAVADLSTTIPGGTTTFTSFAVPDLKGNTLLYGGSSASETGLFLSRVGVAPTIVANQNTPIPDGIGDFTFVGSPTFDALTGNVAFRGSGSSDNGIYALVNDQLTRVAERNMTAPGGGFFQGFDATAPSISGDDVVFEATRSSGASTFHGLYLWNDGAISKIVEVGDLVPDVPAGGHVLSSIGALSADSFSDSSVAFVGTSSGGYQGVFLATLPEPTCCALLVPLMFLVGRGRRRQRS